MTTRTNSNNTRLRTGVYSGYEPHFARWILRVCSRFFVVEQRARTLHHARVIFAKIVRSFCGDCEMTAEIMCSEYKIDIFIFAEGIKALPQPKFDVNARS